MRTSAPILVTLVAIAAFCGCDHPVVSQSPVSPSSVSPTPVSPTPTPVSPGVLAFSSFAAIANQWGIRAEYTLTETSGNSGVTLESLRFEESGGLQSGVLDAGCWGDYPIAIAPRGSLDGKTLGYCYPWIETKSPGEFAALIAEYKQRDGRRDSVRALVRVVRQ